MRAVRARPRAENKNGPGASWPGARDVRSLSFSRTYSIGRAPGSLAAALGCRSRTECDGSRRAERRQGRNASSQNRDEPLSQGRTPSARPRAYTKRNARIAQIDSREAPVFTRGVKLRESSGESRDEREPGRGSPPARSAHEEKGPSPPHPAPRVSGDLEVKQDVGFDVPADLVEVELGERRVVRPRSRGCDPPARAIPRRSRGAC